MDRLGILKKVIDKAEKNGFNTKKTLDGHYYDGINKIKFMDCDCIYFSDDDYIAIQQIIFNHEFAKAFFGSDLEFLNLAGCYEGDIEIWRYHLQRMVLEEEPLKYLEEFIN